MIVRRYFIFNKSKQLYSSNKCGGKILMFNFGGFYVYMGQQFLIKLQLMVKFVYLHQMCCERRNFISRRTCWVSTIVAVLAHLEINVRSYKVYDRGR